jgi:hypothetical protein
MQNLFIVHTCRNLFEHQITDMCLTDFKIQYNPLKQTDNYIYHFRKRKKLCSLNTEPGYGFRTVNLS